MPVTSSVATQWAVVQAQKGSHAGLVAGFLADIAGSGTHFTARMFGSSPVIPCSGDTVRATSSYTLTGFRGELAASGAIFMLACPVRVMGGQFLAKPQKTVEARSFNWHFVGVVWIALLTTFYVVG